MRHKFWIAKSTKRIWRKAYLHLRHDEQKITAIGFYDHFHISDLNSPIKKFRSARQRALLDSTDFRCLQLSHPKPVRYLGPSFTDSIKLY